MLNHGKEFFSYSSINDGAEQFWLLDLVIEYDLTAYFQTLSV